MYSTNFIECEKTGQGESFEALQVGPWHFAVDLLFTLLHADHRTALSNYAKYLKIPAATLLLLRFFHKRVWA